MVPGRPHLVADEANQIRRLRQIGCHDRPFVTSDVSIFSVGRLDVVVTANNMDAPTV